MHTQQDLHYAHGNTSTDNSHNLESGNPRATRTILLLYTESKSKDLAKVQLCNEHVTCADMTGVDFKLTLFNGITPSLRFSCTLQESGSVRARVVRKTDLHSNAIHDSHRRVLRVRKSPHRGRPKQRRHRRRHPPHTLRSRPSHQAVPPHPTPRPLPRRHPSL